MYRKKYSLKKRLLTEINFNNDLHNACKYNSNGFIDSLGNWVQLPNGTHHDDYLLPLMRSDRLSGKDISHYNSWIKVSNAGFITISDWKSLPRQVNGLVEMWLTCAKYTKWIFDSYEGGESFYIHNDDVANAPAGYGEKGIETTIADFLSEFADDGGSYFYEKLMEQL